MNVQGSLLPPEPDDIPAALDIEIIRQAIDVEEADRVFRRLLDEVAWTQERVTMFGRVMDIPRLTAWYGDPGRTYTYSGIALTPQSWTPLLEELRASVECLAGCRFNSVLLNLYRNGNDSVSWHADDEPDLGRTPIIGSLSLGASRRFEFRKRTDHGERFRVTLDAGDVVVMRGTSQQLWEHQLPKDKVTEPRINLTFRRIG
ncbi:MAG: alpha-ketoglutarate-dependent dioxygenase AlkB, partial [Acidobacteria bacterium]|nr:alpha-ketoglutarate-dependent dioxygenase AlkB [Acidobacteriota bacterium]